MTLVLMSNNGMYRAYVLLLLLLLLLLYAYVMPMYAQRAPACIPTLAQSKPMLTLVAQRFRMFH